MLLKSTRTARSSILCAVVSALFLLSPFPLCAEGSRELIDFEEAQGGDARYAMRNADSTSGGNPGWGIFEVYAQAGETLHVGSNTLHTGNGNIYVWEPGTPVISDTFPSALFASAALDCVAQAGGDTNVGLIDTRAKEQAGPEVTAGDGGYASCQLAAATSGLYLVMFRAVVDSGANPSDMSISDPNIGTQNTTAVHAWDVTVRDSGGMDQPGRLMSRWLALYETGGGGPDQQIFVLTRDGHRYRAIFDELNGINWFMFSNNKGVQDRATGEPTYLSWPSSAVNDPMDPQFIHPVYADDTAEDVTNRIFVNPPDPLVITGTGGLGALLGYQADPGFLPAPTDLQFDGTASGGGIAMAPNGFTDSVFTFDSDPSLDGVRYSLAIDADRNGSYGDTADRRLGGIFDSTGNSLPFDGTDGLGNPLDFDQIYTARIQGTGAEAHFPLADVENFGNGLTIERLTNLGAGDIFRAAYDDFNGSALTDTMPVSLPGGGDSSVTGFHAWGANSGNADTIDTWTFTAVTGPAVTQFAVGSPAGGVPPAFSKAFSPNPVAALEVTTLTFFIDNLANPVAADSLDFSDTFPAGMTVANPANAATDCTGGTLTATPGAGSMSYTGGSIAANSLCSVSVDVTSDTQGLSANVSGELTSDLGSSGTASDTLEVLAPLPVADLATVKQASAANVESGGTLTYTITVTNNSATVTVPDVVVIDDLPLEVTLLGTSGCAEDPLGAPLCTLGSLAPGASTFYTIEVQVDAADGASLVNTAIATSEQTNDDDPTNDISTAEVIVGLIAIPTLDIVGFSLLALLLVTAALRRLRRI